MTSNLRHTSFASSRSRSRFLKPQVTGRDGHGECHLSFTMEANIRYYGSLLREHLSSKTTIYKTRR
jgi:hypothetical protein